MPATAVGQSVVVEIEGITQPTQFSDLAAAVTATWRSLRELPLGWYQYEAYCEFFGESAVERVAGFLESRGGLVLSFTMAGGAHVVRIRPAARIGR